MLLQCSLKYRSRICAIAIEKLLLLPIFGTIAIAIAIDKKLPRTIAIAIAIVKCLPKTIAIAID